MPAVADVVVIGAGVAGTIAAIECAKVGLDVRLVSDPDEPTSVQSGTLAGIQGIDFGAESFAPNGVIAQLCQELGLRTETLRKRNTLLATGSITAPMPANVCAGIPGNPFAADLVAFAPGAKLRAYADRVMPFLKIGEAENLGALVGQRLGHTIRDGFTDAYARAVYGLPAELVDIPRVAPKLNSTLTSLGTLSGAALALSSEDESQVRAVGGLETLTGALTARAENYAVTCVADVVQSVTRRDDHWLVTSTGGSLQTRAVIAAIDPDRLGSPRQPGVAETERRVQVITAAVVPEYDTEFTGVLFSADLELLSAARPASRSDALHSVLATGTDIVRVVVHAAECDPAISVQRAAEVLGLGTVQILELDLRNWSVLRPWVGHMDPLTDQRVADETGTLEWTGQWTSGSGLDRVARHASDVAHRVRRIALDLRIRAGS